MTLGAVLSTALTGLGAAQQALAVTANNVANAGTEGFTRKVARQETLVVDGQGRGVRTLDAERIVDDYLNAELRTHAGRLGERSVVAEAQDRLQVSVFGSPGDEAGTLSGRIDAVTTAIQALAATPESRAGRLGVVAAVGTLLDGIADAAATVQAMRRDADQEIARTVATVNGDLAALADVQADIARSGPTAELEDRRDRLMASLATNLDISSFRRENGLVSVGTAGGIPLLENGALVLRYRPAAQVDATATFGEIAVYRPDQLDPETGEPLAGETGDVLVSRGVRAVLTPELGADATPDADQRIVALPTSGRLAGLLQVRDRILPEVADQLAELADLATVALNAGHNAAAASSPPATLDGTRTDLSGFAAAPRSGTAYVAVVDRTTGSTLSVVAVDMTAASAAGLAAQLDSDLAGFGDAVIGGDGALHVSLTDPGHGIAISEGDSQIAVSDLAGRDRTFGFSAYFGLNDLVVQGPDGAASRRVRPDIAADPGLLASARLDVSAGLPLTASLGGAGDGRGARALADALGTGFATAARGDLAARTTALADYAADVVATAARRADAAQTGRDTQQALVDDLAARQGAVSGVNLDEELSRLVTYQQAYSVAARLIAVTDELFGDLLAIKR
ncbi:MAG: flagellar basal body rod C-terminal domain-containing protein [Geminicoccaceae bacterium]